MSNFYDWDIVGFYDGKILILKEGLKAKECIFLDMEIFRKDIRSLGQHMVMFNQDKKVKNWENFSNCIQPNNLRGYDAKHSFNLKYPFGSVHLLLGIIGSKKEIKIENSAICPLLYTDGTFKNLFNFPENCLSWLNYLKADNKKSPLHSIFFNDHYTISSLMLALKDFFSKLKLLNNGKRGADKIKISNSKGKIVNLIKKNNLYHFEPEIRELGEKFLNLLGDLTGWNYKEDNWLWDSFSLYEFEKGTIKPSNARYNELMEKEPLSLAMTSSLAIEYTLEKPNKLP